MHACKACPISSNDYENPKNYLHNLLINCFSPLRPHDLLHLASSLSNVAENFSSKVCKIREIMNVTEKGGGAMFKQVEG